MADSIQVRGGVPLNGEISVLGAKNAVLKLMVASLLAPGTHRIENVPRILDEARKSVDSLSEEMQIVAV